MRENLYEYLCEMAQRCQTKARGEHVAFTNCMYHRNDIANRPHDAYSLWGAQAAVLSWQERAIRHSDTSARYSKRAAIYVRWLLELRGLA